MAKQAKRHQPGRRPEITRDTYNAVRKYDRRSFEKWALNIYDCGYEDGRTLTDAAEADAREAGFIEGLKEAAGAITGIRGVGAKKQQEIKDALSALLAKRGGENG